MITQYSSDDVIDGLIKVQRVSGMKEDCV
jgi:hypothetical protein